MGTTAEELRIDIERQRMEVSRDLDALGDRVSPSRVVERRTEAVKGRFRGMRDAVMGSADDVSHSAHDRMGSMGDSAHGAMESVSDTVSGVPDMARERTQGSPLVAGAIAFGVGLLAAAVLPESRKERQLAHKVQPQLESAAHAAGASGRQVAEEMTPVVQEHAGQLQDSAKEKASGVADSAKDSATHVQDEAKGKAHEVKPS